MNSYEEFMGTNYREYIINLIYSLFLYNTVTILCVLLF